MSLRRARSDRAAIRVAVLTCVLACVAAVVGGAPARIHASPAHTSSSTEADEYVVKAAFLYKFASYTKWPKHAFESPTSPLVVAVVGKDPFGKRLEKTIGSERVKKHPIVIRRYESAEDIEGAHVLFLGEMKEKERKACLKKMKGKPALVVADRGGVIATGATIGFYIDKKRVAFEVAPWRISAAKLRMSSRVLKVARIVEDPREKEEDR